MSLPSERCSYSLLFFPTANLLGRQLRLAYSGSMDSLAIAYRKFLDYRHKNPFGRCRKSGLGYQKPGSTRLCCQHFERFLETAGPGLRLLRFENGFRDFLLVCET